MEINGEMMFAIATLGLGVNLLLLKILGPEHHHGINSGHDHSHSHGHSHGHGDNLAMRVFRYFILLISLDIICDREIFNAVRSRDPLNSPNNSITLNRPLSST